MKTISINRAPVLTLWAAVVAQRLGFDEDEALTLGKAVAGLNAQAKGRRLGIFNPHEKKPKKAREKAPGYQGGNPIDPDSVRRYLDGKFGDDLKAVRSAMQKLAKAYKPKDSPSYIEAREMTDKEWRNSAEPQAMLEFLQKSGTASKRKLRLFAVACSRHVWDWIDALGRSAVEAAESFADGHASQEALRTARLACQGAGGQAAWVAATNPAIAARNAARSAQAGVANIALLGSEAGELLAQARLVREIFGDPFLPFSFDPSWLTPTVVELAQTIYDDRTFDRMPELADALEVAGCDDADILTHCRQAGEHVRGCWVVDLIGGKE